VSDHRPTFDDDPEMAKARRLEGQMSDEVQRKLEDWCGGLTGLLRRARKAERRARLEGARAEQNAGVCRTLLERCEDLKEDRQPPRTSNLRGLAAREHLNCSEVER